MKPEIDLEEYPYIEEYQGSYIWIVLFVAAILLLFVIIGITYSFYDLTIRGNKQPISQDLIFNYSDVNGRENGIFIQDANETSDEIGKKLVGSKNLFEFNVSGNANNHPGGYTIVLEKDEASTILDSDMKVYLTKVQGNTETEVSSTVLTYSELDDILLNGQTYKKIYSEKLEASDGSFSQDYHLRMWIREGATDFYQKTYSLKVHVFLEGTGE